MPFEPRVCVLLLVRWDSDLYFGYFLVPLSKLVLYPIVLSCCEVPTFRSDDKLQNPSALVDLHILAKVIFFIVYIFLLQLSRTCSQEASQIREILVVVDIQWVSSWYRLIS